MNDKIVRLIENDMQGMKKGIVMAVALSILFNSLYALASAEELPLFASDADESAFRESLDMASDEGEMPAFVQTVEMAMGDMAIGEGAAVTFWMMGAVIAEESALYDTGVTAGLGDHFLTLSTCDYHGQEGRFVVVAKEIGRYGIFS